MSQRRRDAATDLLRRPVRALGARQLARDGDRLHPGHVDWHEKLTRRAAAQRAVALHPLLPRRGLGHRQPVAVHRRRAAGGAEVLPRHPAGRRGAPRRLLPSLHAARSSGVGDGTIAGALRATEQQLTWGHRKVSAGSTRWPTSCAPTAQAPQLARADDALPRRRRGDAGPARPALHRALPGAAATSSPASARACATSRWTSSATSASGSSCSPTSTPRTRSWSRDATSASAARGRCRRRRRWPCRRTGTTLHRVLRVHLRGPGLEEGTRSLEQKLRAIGLPLDRCRRFPMPMDLPPRSARAAGGRCSAANLIGPSRPVARDPETLAIMFDSIAPQRGLARRAPGDHDPVGLHRCRALAHRRSTTARTRARRAARRRPT